MGKNKTVTILAAVIIPLALIAAAAGLFWQGSGDPYPFTTLRGETVMMRGHGLYRFDTVSSSSQEIGQDIVTLLVGIPLLLAGTLLTRRGSLRGKLLLTGALGYFLYTYASMSFLTAFNSLFLVYVAIFSLSLFAFILALSGIDLPELVAKAGQRYPRRQAAIYFLVVAGFLSLAWLGLVIPPILKGTPPAGLETAITMVIQALDLGVIVPTSIITAVLLLKDRPWGYALSAVVLMKIFTMGSAIISMVIVQYFAGVKIDPVTSGIFIIISLAGIALGAAALRSIRD